MIRLTKVKRDSVFLVQIDHDYGLDYCYDNCDQSMQFKLNTVKAYFEFGFGSLSHR